MTSWFDSHCHLDSVEDSLEAVVERARAANVVGLVTVGTSINSSRRSIEIAGTLGWFATVGVHPHDASTFDEQSLVDLDRLSGAPEVVGIGESGLDYYRDLSPREDQKRVFVEHIRLARRLGKALVIHVRDAHNELFSILEEEGPPERLVFHCFSGAEKEAHRALDLGGHLSFAGNISYKKAESLRAAARLTPLDRLLVETDSPYLAPMPHRGRPNEPAFVPLVGAALADAIGRDVAEVAAATTENARRVFGIVDR